MTDQQFENLPEAAEPPPGETAEPFPWPPPRGEGVIASWGRTWRGASLRPARFFGALPSHTPHGPALLYYLSIGIPVAGANLFWRMIGLTVPAGTASALGMAGAWGPLIDFLTSPLTLLLTLYLAAGVTHLMLLLFGGAGGGAGTTARVFAYAYSPQLLGIVPVAGTIVGFVWMVVVAIIGLRAAHRTTTLRAGAAVLIPVAIGMFIAFLGLLLARSGELLRLLV
ncbi:MAG TPA: YIP1 family protein [Longimicrobiales bacterium]